MMVAFEIVHHMKNKGRGKIGEVALKINIIKAYDSVNWEFLRPILPHRGLRQSDSLSLYLFILCAEGLSFLLSQVEVMALPDHGRHLGLPSLIGRNKKQVFGLQAHVQLEEQTSFSANMGFRNLHSFNLAMPGGVGFTLTRTLSLVVSSRLDTSRGVSFFLHWRVSIPLSFGGALGYECYWFRPGGGALGLGMRGELVNLVMPILLILACYCSL
ncbi:hypothetical protein J1N35_026771 [Gossypium stocksii]|uniref:Reverse transcriptase domain-containing protein n=1 Tax=Gossypium stocksii TaxID=47602 RepID=A0A9D3VB75_9ROSI|nr:hypothetical protein J1N35_026771 [Gossypium stocksii]